MGMNQFGISDRSWTLLQETFRNQPQVKEAIIFGSRAKGNFRRGSDIDLAIKGEECTKELALELQAYMNEVLPIPYKIDVIDYHSLDHHDLREHIDRVGKLFYSRLES